MRKFILFLIILCSSFLTGFAQSKDTFRFSNGINSRTYPFSQSNWTTSDDGISLSEKIIRYTGFHNLPGLVILTDSAFKTYINNESLLITKQVDISNCLVIADTNSFSFYYLWPDSLSELINPVNDKGPDIEFNKDVFIAGCKSSTGLLFSHMKSEQSAMFFSKDTFYRLDMEHVKFQQVSLDKCKLNLLNINNSTIQTFSLSNGDSTVLKDTAEANFENRLNKLLGNRTLDSLPPFYSFISNYSNFDLFRVANIKTPIIVLQFDHSTINHEFSFSDRTTDTDDEDETMKFIASQIRMDSVKHNDTYLGAIFSNSNIDGNVINHREKRFLTYTFEKCRFGENADLSNMNFDTLIINNCTKILSGIYLKIPSNYPVYLSIYNSDVSKINFNYTSNVHFLADPYDNKSQDEINNSYTALLDKFRSEGKKESYERLDVEFRQWGYAQRGIWGKFVNSIDRYWWYYGYKKYYVIFWSFALLLLFSILNFLFWAKLKSTYPLIENEKAYRFDKANKKNNLVKSIQVLIITFFIFFSFRLEFNKIRYDNTKMLVLFFLQYVIGLICLFFIVNFILKF